MGLLDSNSFPVRLSPLAIALFVRNAGYLLSIQGANHFSIAHPVDLTLGTLSLDYQATQPEDSIRDLLADAICLFVEAQVCCQSTASIALHELLENNPSIASFDYQ